MPAIAAGEPLDSGHSCGRGQLGANTRRRCADRRLAADLAREIEGLQRVLAPPDHPGPGEPLSPSGHVAPAIRVPFCKARRQRVLAETHGCRAVIVSATAIGALGKFVVEGPIALEIALPETLGFLFQPVLWPGRIDAGEVVALDLVPGLARRDVPFAAASDQ